MADVSKDVFNFVIFRRILCVFMFVLVVVPYEMPALTSEKLEKILDEKLRPISDLSEQLEKDKTTLVEENASLRTQILSITNDLKQPKKSLNDLEHCPRRDCTEIRGIPLSEEPSKEDTNDTVIQSVKRENRCSNGKKRYLN